MNPPASFNSTLSPPERRRKIIRRVTVLAGAVTLIAGASALRAQRAPTIAGLMELQIRSRVPTTGIVFHDPSPRPSNHDLAKSTYVGYQQCAGCHGAFNSLRPHDTVIQEWESSTNAHSKDVTNDNGLNVYARTVADGIQPPSGTKSCGTCHATGAPDVDQPQVAQQGGWDPSEPFNNYLHNGRLLKVQCENCHGPGSQHVQSGGNPQFINRVPDPRQTCWKCHVHTPNDKGNIPTAPISDAELPMWASSLGHSHNPGVLIAGTGGYEYNGEDYSTGHSQPHTKIAATCVTCHTFRPKNSPILDHSEIGPKIEACRYCHADARRVPDVDHYPFMEARQATITSLLIQLGGATTTGAPDSNAGGGLLGNAVNKTSPDYQRAHWNFSLVLNDGSLGVHNFDYAVELLTTSIAHAPAQKGSVGATKQHRATKLAALENAFQSLTPGALFNFRRH